MKRSEHILGILSTSLLIIGLFFKYNHWPFSHIIVLSGYLLFNFGYLPVQLIRQRRTSETTLQKIYIILRFISFFAILTGLPFKMMHWPGAGIALLSSAIMMPLYIFIYFLLRIKKQAAPPFQLNDLLLSFIALAVLIFFMSSRVSTGVTGGYRLIEDQFQKMNAGLESANQTIFESLAGVQTPAGDSLIASIGELRRLGMEYSSSFDEIKQEFYRLILQERYAEQSTHQRVYNSQLAEISPVHKYFLDQGKAQELKALVDSYMDGVEALAVRHRLQSGFIGVGLNTDDIIYNNGYQYSWISYIFEDVPVGSVIVNLSLLRQMELLTENSILNGLIGQLDLSAETLMIQELAARESDKAMKLKENEIVRVKQQQKLQAIQLESSLAATKQNRMMAIFGFVGIAFVLVLLTISTRGYVRKQRDNKLLAEQKEKISEANEELNQQNEEIAAQRDEIEAQRDLVSKQKEQIEITHAEISSSIDYAKRLQGSILPNTSLLTDNFQDHFVFFRPKDKVSGDFYWWTEVEGKIIITATDCTGHGVPGAFMSMLGISLLREIVNKEFITRPAVILRRLRKEVIYSLDQKGEFGEQKDGMDMALISIDPKTLECEYAGAYNPLYLVRDGELTEYKADRMPVSHYQQMAKFTNQEIKLRKGDQLYLFSDGYVDQFGGERRKKLKYPAFKQTLKEHSGEDMARQSQSLLDTLVQWQGDQEQIDDMVIIGIKI